MINFWKSNGFTFMIRFRRFKFIVSFISGFKKGRLPGKLYTYNRFKPVYLAWGLTELKVCDLRKYNTWTLRAEFVPIRFEAFVTPKDIWEHWQSLKRRNK